MRTPSELGYSPSPASITPAFTSSSLKLPIAARAFSSGSAPLSDSFVAFTITMKRIVILLVRVSANLLTRRRTDPGRIDTTPRFFWPERALVRFRRADALGDRGRSSWEHPREHERAARLHPGDDRIGTAADDVVRQEVIAGRRCDVLAPDDVSA